MSAKAQLITDAASAASSKITYSCFGLSFLSDWLFNAVTLPWLTFTLAFLTFIVNLYYKRQENKRAEEMHSQNMGKKNDSKKD